MSDLAVAGRTIGQFYQCRKVALDNIEQQFYNMHTKRGHLFSSVKKWTGSPVEVSKPKPCSKHGGFRAPK